MVPEHLAQARVQTLRCVVRARPRAYRAPRPTGAWSARSCTARPGRTRERRTLDPRSRPAASHGVGEAGAVVGDDVRRWDRVHQRRPRPRRLRARHAPRDDALDATAYQYDEVACGPDPVDEGDAVPLVVRDGHGRSPQNQAVQRLNDLPCPGMSRWEPLDMTQPRNSRRAAALPSRRTSRRRYLRRLKEVIYLRIRLSSGHTFRPSTYNRRRVLKSRERAVHLCRWPRMEHTFCPIAR